MILSDTMTTTGTSNTKIKIYDKVNLKSRNYKIDKDVLDEFVKFCNVQKLTNGYLVSDLATNALLEYMEKFNKVS